MIKEYETTVSKINYYDKKKKNEFLEDFCEISLVCSLKILKRLKEATSQKSRNKKKKRTDKTHHFQGYNDPKCIHIIFWASSKDIK